MALHTNLYLLGYLPTQLLGLGVNISRTKATPVLGSALCFLPSSESWPRNYLLFLALWLDIYSNFPNCPSPTRKCESCGLSFPRENYTGFLFLYTRYSQIALEILITLIPKSSLNNYGVIYIKYVSSSLTVFVHEFSSFIESVLFTYETVPGGLLILYLGGQLVHTLKDLLPPRRRILPLGESHIPDLPTYTHFHHFSLVKCSLMIPKNHLQTKCPCNRMPSSSQANACILLNMPQFSFGLDPCWDLKGGEKGENAVVRSNQKWKKDYEQDQETGKQGHVGRKAPAHGAGPHCERVRGCRDRSREQAVACQTEGGCGVCPPHGRQGGGGGPSRIARSPGLPHGGPGLRCHWHVVWCHIHRCWETGEAPRSQATYQQEGALWNVTGLQCRWIHGQQEGGLLTPILCFPCFDQPPLIHSDNQLQSRVGHQMHQRSRLYRARPQLHALGENKMNVTTRTGLIYLLNTY